MKIVNYCLLLPAAIGQGNIFGGAAVGDASLLRYPYPGGGRACTLEAKVCPDGSTVGRTGPNCEFAPCPGGGGGRSCTREAKACPDGSSVGRIGPNCEFAPCPVGGTICTADAKICPDGRTVGRTGPNCQFDCSSGATDPWNPTWPTNPSWPTYPGYPTYPSWPSNPTYPGMAACRSHSQCGSGQYCYSCSKCMSTPGCPMTSTCQANPTGGECATLANCQRDQDAIDGVCPGSWGGGGGVGGGISPCATVLCPRGQRCIPEPKQCFTTPCPQYRCEGDFGGGTSSCAAVTCPVGQQCVAETSPCFNPPCPTFRCEPVVGGGGGGGWNPCQPNPCRWDQQCVRFNIVCVTTPCPQYQCIGGGGGSGGGSQQCGPNEVWETCGSSSCWEQKCSDSGPWPPRGCTFDCRSGCKCKEGYKRGYNGECTEFCYVLGRPYSSDKGFLVAPVLSTPSIHTTVNSAIETNASDPLFTNMLSEEQLLKAAKYWAKVAMMEHASVASFSRFSLELMSVGASPELLALAHQAALDEVRHTQISLNIANEFSSTTFTPGAFPISSKAADFAFGDMEKIASAAALEACIEETLAAAVVLYQAEHMGDSNHKALLRAVALDEASHAAFAWRAVKWMASTSPAVHSAVSAVFSERAKQYEVAPEAASVPSLEHLGLLDQGTIAKVQYDAWHQVVVPAAVSLGFLPSGGSQASAGDAQPVADVIAHALMSCNQTPVA